MTSPVEPTWPTIPVFRTNRDRVANRQALIAILEDLFTTKTTEEWVELLEGAGIPNAPVNTFADLVEDPQVAHRNMIVNIPHPTIAGLRGPASPLKLSHGPSSVRRRPPATGEHTRDSRGLDMDEADITDLEASRAVETHCRDRSWLGKKKRHPCW